MLPSIQAIFEDYLIKVKNLYEEITTTKERKNKNQSKLDTNKKIRKNRKLEYKDEEFNLPEEKPSILIEKRNLMQYSPYYETLMERKHEWESYDKNSRKKDHIRSKRLFSPLKTHEEPTRKYKTQKSRPKKLLTPVKEENEFFGFDEMGNRNIAYGDVNPNRWDDHYFRQMENNLIL